MSFEKRLEAIERRLDEAERTLSRRLHNYGAASEWLKRYVKDVRWLVKELQPEIQARKKYDWPMAKNTMNP